MDRCYNGSRRIGHVSTMEEDRPVRASNQQVHTEHKGLSVQYPEWKIGKTRAHGTSDGSRTSTPTYLNRV